MFPFFFVWSLFMGTVLCLSSSPRTQSGIEFVPGSALPLLHLPYATYRAAKYDDEIDVYYFKNIRFAAPPTGKLRFEKPASPKQETTLQTGEYGPSCIQNVPLGLFNLGILDKTPLGDMIDGGFSRFAGGTDEDCLFLDVQVPGRAIRAGQVSFNLPVAVYFHGGAYTFGTKNHVSTKGIWRQAGEDLIIVAANYRLGAYGWLAGTSMENQGTPNLGLYDQRAALQWVQSYIGLVGGDKRDVSAWGESAGAGSIMHHLVAFGGAQDPLFAKAVLISPAFQLQYDRAGSLEDSFRLFAAAAGCPSGSLACLRDVDSRTLRKANAQLIDSAAGGTSVIGPASDGSWVRQLAGLEFEAGHYWKQLESLVVTHTSDEAILFTPLRVSTDAQLESLVESIIPAYAKPSVAQSILDKYGGTAASPRSRYKAFVRDATFTCNVRTLLQAYEQRVWSMQYSASQGFHSCYLWALFFDPSASFNLFGLHIKLNLLPLLGNVAERLQGYLTSHAIHGDPNIRSRSAAAGSSPRWPPARPTNDTYQDVLDVGNLGFRLITNSQISDDSDAHCGFVSQMSRALVELGGYGVDVEEGIEDFKDSAALAFLMGHAPVSPFASLNFGTAHALRLSN
ncbi:hypothetical protein ASPZODRAFT_19957 [Penicilliopsis zonata CBS 506.65]|uniref:Carboxylesterase type B domain-containing protein n=1 Tax=Penicilliopsis zonata CBS 506.65 TaxID=1073090 RepID=A0A1L9S744_9EURO|nr:hypothetical protein ASPZODRAFT_19957 [Penicilliopsis zonata CBS 506.65]OJJ42979.1 hypothetical protein ASPZODRAFT_19957 [Penicilliopsis zonata CBS 506.65]